MSTATAPTRLYRSTRDKRIAGVCGGIAESMGWDPTTVRLIAALSVLLPGPQFLAYFIAWIVLPTDEEAFATQTVQYPSADPSSTGAGNDWSAPTDPSGA